MAICMQMNTSYQLIRSILTETTEYAHINKIIQYLNCICSSILCNSATSRPVITPWQHTPSSQLLCLVTSTVLISQNYRFCWNPQSELWLPGREKCKISYFQFQSSYPIIYILVSPIRSYPEWVKSFKLAQCISSFRKQFCTVNIS